jgi:hypothetical protein
MNPFSGGRTSRKGSKGKSLWRHAAAEEHRSLEVSKMQIPVISSLSFSQ